MSLQQDMKARPLLWIGIIFVLFIIAAFLRIGDFVEFSTETLRRYGFLKSEATRHAEYTARSNFTDNLTRMAWRRMHWGRFAAKRVHDESPLADIDTAWAAYINASADWNAEVMIFIIGLEHHYDSPRRQYFEDKILRLLPEFDDVLGRVRRSGIMRKMRASQTPDKADRDEIEKLYGEVSLKYMALNDAMYGLANLFREKKIATPSVPVESRRD